MKRELVNRAQRGDKEAFAELAFLTGDRLLSIAQRILRDVDQAEDATSRQSSRSGANCRSCGTLITSKVGHSASSRTRAAPKFAASADGRRKICAACRSTPTWAIRQPSSLIATSWSGPSAGCQSSTAWCWCFSYYLGLTLEQVAQHLRHPAGHSPLTEPLRQARDARCPRGRCTGRHEREATGMSTSAHTPRDIDRLLGRMVRGRADRVRRRGDWCGARAGGADGASWAVLANAIDSHARQSCTWGVRHEAQDCGHCDRRARVRRCDSAGDRADPATITKPNPAHDRYADESDDHVHDTACVGARCAWKSPHPGSTLARIPSAG